MGSPFLVTQGAPEVCDYTGVITVSGRRSGIVYFSAPRGMLTVLLMKMNESDVSHENLCDLVGEVANTISGNVRRDFGKDFAISAADRRLGRGQRQCELPAGCRPGRDPDQLAQPRPPSWSCASSSRSLRRAPPDVAATTELRRVLAPCMAPFP